MRRAGGVQHFIFSSTAAVYGMPESGVASEETPTIPINPYGSSKLMTEWMLRDLSAATPMRHVALRYFNVAGADPGGRIGQSTANSTLLTKVACEAAVGKRDKVFIFGTDYSTHDGTAVRDYIHVTDVSRAHVDALLTTKWWRFDDPELRLRSWIQRSRGTRGRRNSKRCTVEHRRSPASSRRSAHANRRVRPDSRSARLEPGVRRPRRHRRERVALGTSSRGGAVSKPCRAVPRFQ